jgi:hypothetical protein
MKFAICFYGFLKDFNSSIIIDELIKNILYNNTENLDTYDIYYNIPDQLTEFSEEFTIEERNSIYNIFKLINIKGNKFINFHKYNPSLFLKDINDKKIDLYSETTNYISVRILSLMYNINETINLLNTISLTYDKIIVTRLDLLDVIQNINIYNKLFMNNIIYLLRSHPYRVDSNNLHAEDRIFVGSQYCISKLKNIYNFTINNWDIKNSWNEKIVYMFYRQFNDIVIEYNDDFSIQTKINHNKYTPQYLSYYTNLYNCYLSSLY